jgi:pyruvate,orthophosphate dikinase
MVKEKLIDWQTAILRNPADQLEQLLAPIFDPSEVKKAQIIATGLPAGPGAATGKIYFNAERSVTAAERGEKVLLVRVETSPEDLRGMIAAEGILTARGGVSSHAALVARQMGKVCVCGAAAVSIDYDRKTATIDGTYLHRGRFPFHRRHFGRGLCGPDQDGPIRDHRRSDQRRQSRSRHGKIQAVRPAHEVVRPSHKA